MEKDPLFENAADVVRAENRGSTSLLQRKLKIGYMHAARLIDELEEAGVITPVDPKNPAAPRKVNELPH